MNELQQIIKGLDIIELQEETPQEEVYIYENDIENIKNFLEKAQQQLKNLDIKIKVEQ